MYAINICFVFYLSDIYSAYSITLDSSFLLLDHLYRRLRIHPQMDIMQGHAENGQREKKEK